MCSLSIYGYVLCAISMGEKICFDSSCCRKHSCLIYLFFLNCIIWRYITKYRHIFKQCRGILLPQLLYICTIYYQFSLYTTGIFFFFSLLFFCFLNSLMSAVFDALKKNKDKIRSLANKLHTLVGAWSLLAWKYIFCI